MRHSRRISVLVALLAIALTTLAFAQSDEKRKEQREKMLREMRNRAENAARHKQMRRLAERLQLTGPAASTGQRPADPVLIEQPLMRFAGRDGRGMLAGLMWAWTTGGRPVAVMETYILVEEPKKCYLSIVSSSNVAIRATLNDRRVWQPEGAQFEAKPIPDAGVPASHPNVRLRQMKRIARRFRAFEYFGEDFTRTQLRLLPREVYRYADRKTSLLDGALFVLTRGTNPDVMLFVEAHGTDFSTATWKYALIRRGQAESVGLLDRKVVWKVPSIWHTNPKSPIHVFTAPLSKNTNTPNIR